MSAYFCPICNTELKPEARYPSYICQECSSRATDEKGRKLKFNNIDLSGGFTAVYEDSGEPYNSHVCYIDGVKCRADEARFGGIVIEKK